MSHTNGYDTATVAASQIVNDTGWTTIKRSLKRLRAPTGERVLIDGEEVAGLGLLATVEVEGKRRWVDKNVSATNTYSLVPLAERLRGSSAGEVHQVRVGHREVGCALDRLLFAMMSWPGFKTPSWPWSRTSPPPR